MQTLHVVRLESVPILEQLRYEEAALRLDGRNWCLINQGAPPAVVLGISGKPEEDLHLDKVQKQELPLIRRFSGGGTVVVDEDTLFVSLLGNKSALSCPAFPEHLLSWSGQIYEEAFGVPSFAVRENDYVIGDRKVGGNAQYLRKERWLHHTTFLWDYSAEKMSALQMPRRRPEYRKQRSHDDFICRLKDHVPSKDAALDALLEALATRFEIDFTCPSQLDALLTRPHRQSTELLRLSP